MRNVSTSGVGSQSRYLFQGLLNTGKYSVKQFGGAMKHTNPNVVMVPPYGADFVILPTQGFGTPELLKAALVQEKPDVLFLFTDPRFFIWVWEMEEEIHQICPIVYWHIWDNDPYPDFNEVLYKSTDLLNCISYKTFELVKPHFPEKTNYIPHSLPEELFRPLPKQDVLNAKQKFLGLNKVDHFITTWIGRNAIRKNPGHLLIAWKEFLDSLEAKHGHRKATLIMHTDAPSPENEGPNLIKVADTLGILPNVVFSVERIEFEHMNLIHNISDININVSSSEGFGVPTCEAMFAGKPIIGLTTGGQTRQLINWKTGEENGVAMKPDARRCIGTLMCPYIYEDFVNTSTIANAIMKMYDLGPAGREALGSKARAYALEEFSYKKMIEQWDNSLENIIEKWKSDRESVYQPWEVKSL